MTDTPICDDDELPVPVVDSIASWRRVLAAARAEIVPDLLRNAASDLFRTRKIGKTVWPDCDGIVNQAITDALADMAEAAGIDADAAQLIFAMAQRDEARSADHDDGATEQINGNGAAFDDERPPVDGLEDYGFNGKTAGEDEAAFGETLKRLIQSSRQFVAGFVPIDFTVDGLLQEAFLYALTGATGAGKTTITLRLAACVALGILFANRETKKRRVLYLAAENSIDTRMRWIALAQQMDFDPDTIEVYFVEGVFKISQMAGRLKEEAAQLGGEFGLVIVDTGPVFYEGDDENNRNQQGKHAEMLRSLIDIIPGKPTVIANCHPVKNASPDNLSPAGGGNFLNQVDGNLTAAKTDSTIELHWQGKFRGPDFAPMHFMLRTVTHERLVTSTGRLMPTVVCDWISDTAKEEIAKQKLNDEDLILAAIDADPKASQASLAIKMKWTLYSGEPNKMKVSRVLKTLKSAKLISETRAGRYRLTDEGKKALKTA